MSVNSSLEKQHVYSPTIKWPDRWFEKRYFLELLWIQSKSWIKRCFHSTKKYRLTRLVSQLRAVRGWHGEVGLPDGWILTIDLFLQHGQEPDEIQWTIKNQILVEVNAHRGRKNIANAPESRSNHHLYRKGLFVCANTGEDSDIKTFFHIWKNTNGWDQIKKASFSWGCPYLGKCVRMSVRFSGSSLSFSTLNFSRSCRRVTVKMDLSKLRPNTCVVS